MKTELYQQITQQIVADLEKGVRPWQKPWDASHMAGSVTIPLRHNLEPYNGINILMLWSAAIAKGYSAPIWMTFKQAKAMKAHVRKGEKGTMVVYASTAQAREEDPETGEGKDRAYGFLRAYTVFNVEQIDGLPEKFHTIAKPRIDESQRLAQAEDFFHRTGAQIRHGGNSAYYAPGADHVQMPPWSSFESPEAYYETLAHELTHWTSHKSRLDRSFQTQRFGDEGYAMEELVAELGASFLSAELGISPHTRPDHARYIKSWLKILKDDPRAIFTASGHAQKAVTYLKDLVDANPALEEIA